jgi:hypothetical protein
LARSVSAISGLFHSFLIFLRRIRIGPLMNKITFNLAANDQGRFPFTIQQRCRGWLQNELNFACALIWIKEIMKK